MKRVLLIFLMVSLLLTACGQSSPTWQEQYDLGVRYLEDGNYEEAIIAFTAAIEIDPKQPETYLDLAYTYIGQGDFESAKAILTRGYELTQDSRLKGKLDEIESGNITDYWGNFRKMSSYDDNGILQWYHLYDYTVDGIETTVTSYDASGNQTGHVDLVYGESGEELVSYNYDDETGAVGRVVYEYEGGNQVKEIWYSEQEEIIFYLLKEFNTSDQLVKSEQFASDGALELYYIYEYNGNGETVRMSRYRPDGGLDGYDSFEYDSMGNEIRMDCYEGDGALSWSEVSRYDAQGRYLGYDIYDETGNLIGSTVNES